MTRKELAELYEITPRAMYNRLQNTPKVSGYLFKRLNPKELRIIFDEFGAPIRPLPPKYQYLLPKDQ